MERDGERIDEEILKGPRIDSESESIVVAALKQEKCSENFDSRKGDDREGTLQDGALLVAMVVVLSPAPVPQAEHEEDVGLQHEENDECFWLSSSEAQVVAQVGRTRKASMMDEAKRS